MADEFNVREAGQKRARWEEIGETSGASIIHQAAVTLDNDEIKLLPDPLGAVEVVPAQGADTIIQLVEATVVFDDSAGTYTAVGGRPSWSLQLGVSGELVSTLITGPTVGPAGIHYGYMTPWLQPNTSGDWDGNLTLGSFFDVSALANQPLVFQDYYDPPANYTDGNAANTLIVSVAYYILNTVTGEFE